MRIIPQRELRNQSGKVLRQAEAGETFIITVDGRPVATLGPYRRRQWVPEMEIREVLATATDGSLAKELRDADEGISVRDPWKAS